MTIRKEDLADADVVDAQELASLGTTIYRTMDVSGTLASGSLVTFPNDDAHRLDLVDYPVEAGDLLTISGSLASGTYHVADVPTQWTLQVLEVLPDSIGGSATFVYPAGASRVGVDTRTFTYSMGSDVAAVLYDLDQAAAAAADLRRMIFKFDGGLVYDNNGDPSIKVNP